MTALPVEVVIADRTARITLNRPEFGNALNQATCEGLERAAAMIAEAETRIGCVLLCANGRNFCVGGDAPHMEASPTLAQGISELVTPLHRAIATIDNLGLPLVVAVRGAAAGAGMSLVALADYAVGADDAKFVMAYSAIGLTPDGGGSWSLPRAIGLRRAMELSFTNRRLDAKEALSWGLLNEVCAADEVDTRASEMAHRLAYGATNALIATKKLFRTSSERTLIEQLAIERETIIETAGSSDAGEGLLSLREKRMPNFTGR
jgi:2-(1,2-epoxy-1,2-dihydrophenyl)acetyl-CoA isomerase